MAVNSKGSGNTGNSGATWLAENIDLSIKDLRRRKFRSELFASGLKVTATLLAVTVTVLLGVKVDPTTHDTLSNIALIFGAVISVASALDALFNPRAFWILFGSALNKLLITNEASPQTDEYKRRQ